MTPHTSISTTLYTLRSSRLISWLIPLVLLQVVFWIHFLSPVFQGGDSRWAIPLTVSILQEGNLDLDEFSNHISPQDARIDQIGEHFFSYFPYGSSLFAVPVVSIAGRLNPAIMSDPFPYARQLELLVAALAVALTTVVVYLIGRLRDLSYGSALLFALVFSFGTSAWSTASRALWQHGPSMLMLAIALYLLLRARHDPHLVQYAGLPLAFAFTIRPTNSLSILAVGLYILIYHRPYVWRYILWGMVVAVPFIWMNLYSFGAFMPRYFLPDRVGSTSYFTEALLGNLISPGRGLLIFTPIVLLIVYIVILRIRRQVLDPLERMVIGILLLHWILISTFPHWWGGWSFGARFFTDMMPYLWFLFFPAAQLLKGPEVSARFRTIFIGLALIGVLIHGRGAIVPATYAQWNALPVSIDKDPSRLWAWDDLQFLRGTPLLDPLFPPKFSVTPAEATIYFMPGVEETMWLQFRVESQLYRRLTWHVESSTELQITQIEIPDGIQGEIVIAVPATQMKHGEQKLAFTVSGQNRFYPSREVIVPITITIGDAPRLYLPMIQVP
jgi:hypothetical protein